MSVAYRQRALSSLTGAIDMYALCNRDEAAFFACAFRTASAAIED